MINMKNYKKVYAAFILAGGLDITRMQRYL